MRRSGIPSSQSRGVAAGGGWGTHGRAPRRIPAPINGVQSSSLNGATGTSVGPLTTSDGGPHVVVNFQTWITYPVVVPSVSGDPNCTRNADPAGGGVRLSRSAGRAPP